jgi:hypothetical protein
MATDPVADEAPAAALRVILHLSHLRSMFAVGQALWIQYPTELEWLEAFKDPAFLNTVVDFADLVVAPDPTSYGAAAAALEPFARLVGVDPADLLAVLRTHFTRSPDVRTTQPRGIQSTQEEDRGTGGESAQV